MNGKRDSHSDQIGKAPEGLCFRQSLVKHCADAYRLCRCIQRRQAENGVLAGLLEVSVKVHQQHGALTVPFISLHTSEKMHYTMSVRSAPKMQRGNSTYVCERLQRGQHLC